MAWNKHPSKVLKGLTPAELHLSANHFFSYPVFASLLATEKTSDLLDVFFSAKGTSKTTALLKAKSSSYVDWVKQKTLKIARITAALLFTCAFWLETRPFIAELDLMNMPNVLIKLKAQVLHSVTPLV